MRLNNKRLLDSNVNLINIVEMKYPRKKVDNCLQLTELQLDVNLNIRGSTNITNFK